MRFAAKAHASSTSGTRTDWLRDNHVMVQASIFDLQLPLAASEAVSIWLGAGFAVLAVFAIAWWLRAAADRRARELRRSEDRFRALFENAVEGIYENSAEGGFRSVNPAMARILGYASPEELMKITPEET